MTIAPATRRPRYSPRVEIQLHEGPQFITGLAGMLLALVDLDTEREKAAAAGGQDGDGDQDQTNGQQQLQMRN